MKKILTAVLILLSVIALTVPLTAAGKEYTFALHSDKTSADLDEVVTITLTVKNNQSESFSIYTMQDYIHYDPTLVKIVPGSITVPNDFKATDQSDRIYINRFGLSGIAASGEYTVLTFKVTPLKYGTAKFTHAVYEIAGANLNEFTIETVDTTVVFEEPVPLYGDADGSGVVNDVDLAYLQRYLAEWDGYGEDTVDTSLLDLNGDGRINSVDVAILARHLAEWEGYETIPLA